MGKQSLETKIDVMSANLVNLTQNFEDFRADSRKFVDDISEKVDSALVQSATLKTRTDNFAIFQSIFAIIIGAIATYLGVSTKTK